MFKAILVIVVIGLVASFYMYVFAHPSGGGDTNAIPYTGGITVTMPQVAPEFEGDFIEFCWGWESRQDDGT